MASETKPLAGLRVLDLSSLFAAPQISAFLADFGADVVQVEPPSGDPLRKMGSQRGEQSLLWAVVGRGKRSITLALDREEDRATLLRLVERSDVLVENLPRARLESWGLCWEALSSRNPRLVMVSVSCYGRSGPYRDRPGNGTIAEAFAGLTHMTGEADGPPLLTSLGLGDTLASFWGVIGAILACYHRDARGGAGQHVDVAMYEPILRLHGAGLTQCATDATTPHRSGNRIPGAAPRNLYRSREGHWLAVSGATDRAVVRLLEAIGEDGPEARERFANPRARAAHADELDALLAGWIAARERSAVLDALHGAGIPVSAVNDPASLLADPHVEARGDFVRLEDAGGSLLLLAPRPLLSATPGETLALGPPLGAHNAEVLADWLG